MKVFICYTFDPVRFERDDVRVVEEREAEAWGIYGRCYDNERGHSRNGFIVHDHVGDARTKEDAVSLCNELNRINDSMEEFDALRGSVAPDHHLRSGA